MDKTVQPNAKRRVQREKWQKNYSSNGEQSKKLEEYIRVKLEMTKKSPQSRPFLPLSLSHSISFTLSPGSAVLKV